MVCNMPVQILRSPQKSHNSAAFTLIELSIVLVIIGLIVGGVLVGRDLIATAAVRSQLSQIEQINTAANTFRTKYRYLPGDMHAAEAMTAGLYRTNAPNITGCDGYYATGCGNGDGLLGNDSDYQNGEGHLFLLDLSVTRLVGFTPPTYGYNSGPTDPATFLPAAKIGPPHYVYTVSTNAANYLAVSGVLHYCGFHLGASGGCETSNVMRVADAYSMDTKVDDGLPQSGRATARMLGYSGNVCGNGSATGFLWTGVSTTGCWGDPTTAATAGSATTCYDNSNASGAVQRYSISQNNGSGTNCALSFAFQ